MRFLPAFAGFLLLSTAAVAQPAPDASAPPPDAGQQAAPAPRPPHMGLRQRFNAANTTHDGRLTRDQAQAAGMHGIAVHFDQIDTDKKGYITLQDLKAFRQARQQAKAAQQQQAPAQPPQDQPGPAPQQ